MGQPTNPPRRDVSVVVLVGQQGRALRPCLVAWQDAIAEGVGTSASQLILALQLADEETSTEADGWRARGATVVRSLDGDTGRLMNAAIAVADHDHVIIADADDIVAPNTIRRLQSRLAELPENAIVHPQRVLRFGRFNDVWNVFGQEHDQPSLGDVLWAPLWPRLAIARRDVFRRCPFREDQGSAADRSAWWTWTVDAVIRGLRHEVAEGLEQLRRTWFLEEGEGDRIDLLPEIDLQSLRSALPLVADLDHQAEPPTDETVRRASIGRRALGAVARRLRGLSVSPQPTVTVDASADDPLVSLAWIDPGASWALQHRRELTSWGAFDGGAGRIVGELASGLMGADAIVAVPWLGTGGGDTAAASYARALAETAQFHGRTALLATGPRGKTIVGRVPNGVTFVQMSEAFESLSADWQQRVIAQAIAITRPELILSVNCHHLSNAVQPFGAHIFSSTRLFLTLFGFDNRDGMPSSPLADQAMRRRLGGLEGVLTDNSATAAFASSTLALDPPAIRVIPLPAFDEPPPLDLHSRAYNEVDASPLRLVWPHRLDPDKGVDALIALARHLQRSGRDINIDVWGSAVMSDPSRTLNDFEDVGIRYRGPFEGGLSAIPTAQYHGLLLTSSSEGLPLVLVEALLAGLPVVASDVGGVRDLIRDGETGLLVSHPGDVGAFERAFESLRDVDFRRRIIDGGYRHAIQNHSWIAFREAVDSTFIR